MCFLNIYSKFNVLSIFSLRKNNIRIIRKLEFYSNFEIRAHDWDKCENSANFLDGGR